jgi:glycosyltransferase involved in cell wall biosynthesis
VGRPWIATDHHLAADESRLLRLFAILDRQALRRADAVIVPSHGQARRLQRIVPPDRLHVIYHGIDAAAFTRGADNARPHVRRRYGVADGEPVVAVFGRLEPVKGHADLLEAARHMLQVRPDLHFWIVGEGSLAQALQQQAQALGIAGAVRFLGYQGEVAPLMAASDLIVLPSHHESFGIVLIEAMSLGKPVIASATGGIPEVVRDGVQGLLVAPGRPLELSTRALALLADPAQAAALGEAGRRHVVERFAVRPMAERMAALYRQVVAQFRAATAGTPHESSRLSPFSRS